MTHPAHARFLVRLHFGRVAMPSRYFETYASARRYAGTLRRASIRLILTERECAGLYALTCVALFALAYVQLGA